MPAAVGAGVGVVLVLLVLVAMAVKVVPGDTAFVVERFGRYSRTLAPGVTLTVPFADRVKARVSLLPHQLALAPTKVMAADGHWFSVSPAVTYAVADPVLATYAVASFHLSLQQLAATAVRKLASGLDASALARVGAAGDRGRGSRDPACRAARAVSLRGVPCLTPRMRKTGRNRSSSNWRVP